MDFCHTFCAWGLSRPTPCSGTIATILVLGDCHDYSCARGLSRPPSCSGTVQTTLVLGDSLDHFPTIARRPLSSATCDLYSHTVERHLFSLDLATRLVFLPSSKFGGYISMTHLTVHAVFGSQDFFRPWHHMPTSSATRLRD